MIPLAKRMMAVVAGGFAAILFVSATGDALQGAYTGDAIGLGIVLAWNGCVVGCAVLAWRSAKPAPIAPGA